MHGLAILSRTSDGRNKDVHTATGTADRAAWLDHFPAPRFHLRAAKQLAETDGARNAGEGSVGLLHRARAACSGADTAGGAENRAHRQKNPHAEAQPCHRYSAVAASH